LGELMKQFASQIKRLAIAMVSLMKASANKFESLDIGDITESIGHVKEHVEERIEDAVDDAVDAAKATAKRLEDKLKFWD
jgi:hypothetical protein